MTDPNLCIAHQVFYIISVKNDSRAFPLPARQQYRFSKIIPWIRDYFLPKEDLSDSDRATLNEFTLDGYIPSLDFNDFHLNEVKQFDPLLIVDNAQCIVYEDGSKIHSRTREI